MAKGKYREWITEDGLLLISGWARDGLTDEQIASNIGIRTSTYYEWANRFTEFAEAIKKGKAPVDLQVENALLKKALGYTITVKKPIKVKTKKQLKDKGTIEEEHIEYADEEVYIAPDTAAQCFWLKNRRPDKWRDKREETVSLGQADPETIKEIERIFNDAEAGG